MALLLVMTALVIGHLPHSRPLDQTAAAFPPPPWQKHSMTSLLALLLLGNGVALLVHQTLFAHNSQRFVDWVQFWLRGSMRAEIAVGPRKILTVVHGKIHVV